MAALCCTISRLVAADPSVEVYTEDSVVTEDSEAPVTTVWDGGLSLLPQRPFRFSATITSGYDDNVSTTTGGAGSATAQANFTLSKDLSTARTQLTIVGRASTVNFLDQKDSRGSDVTGGFRVSLRHTVSTRLTLTASVDAAYLTEPEFDSDLEPTRRQSYFRTSNTFTASYAWSARFTTDTSYQLRGLNIESFSFNDRVEQSIGESFRFSWSPRTTLVVDYRLGLIDYQSAPKDSTTHTTLAGLDYQISTRLRATLRGGATFRTYANEANGEQINPNGSASLQYALGPSTSVSWNASYSIEEPNTALALSRTTFRTGLQAGYQFTRRLSGQLGLNYSHNENAGLEIPGLPGFGIPASTDDAVALVLGARYTVNRKMSLTFGLTHTETDSTSLTGSNYSRNRYTAGLSFNF